MGTKLNLLYNGVNYTSDEMIITEEEYAELLHVVEKAAKDDITFLKFPICGDLTFFPRSITSQSIITIIKIS